MDIKPEQSLIAVKPEIEETPSTSPIVPEITDLLKTENINPEVNQATDDDSKASLKRKVSIEDSEDGNTKVCKTEINDMEGSGQVASLEENDTESNEALAKTEKADKKKAINLRKNIRDVMDDNQLDEITLAAQREESERLIRVQEQQRLLREMQRQNAIEKKTEKALSYLIGSSNKTCSTGKSKGDVEQLPNDVVDLVMSHGEEQTVTKETDSGQINLSLDIKDDDDVVAIEEPKEVVTIDDSSDSGSDSDCIIVSDDEDALLDDNDDNADNSGLHVNDTFNVPDNEGRVVINMAHPPDEPDIYLAPQIARTIKPHQIGGVRFLYDNIIESLERFKKSDGFGCILAHSMGLGKTLQLVCFCDIFLRHTPSNRVLFVMPVNTLQNWIAEFNMWLPEQVKEDANGTVRPRLFKIYVLNESHKSMRAKSTVISDWQQTGGVLFIGYELFRMLGGRKMAIKKRGKAGNLLDEETPQSRKMFDNIRYSLIDPGPDLVVCDEGHRIKNAHSSISAALKQIRTKRRVVLTGYPLQNNLLEYWCMVDWVRPNYLGTKVEFTNMFERPILNGQCIDSTPTDIKLMRYRAHVLHSLLVGFVQRRSHEVLQETLPPKSEYVILVRMTEFQRQLYEVFMNEVVRVKKVPNPLKAFSVCCKIWNHPDVLYNFLKKREQDLDLDIDEVEPSDGSKVKVKTVTPLITSGDSVNIDELGTSEESKKLPSVVDDLNTKSIIEPTKSDGIKNGNYESIPFDWANGIINDYVPELLESSPKMQIFFCILEESIKLGERMLLFSQSLLTLNLIEKFLQKNKVYGNDFHWQKNVNYFRLDGSTPATEREKLINEFNRNSSIHLFLVSTRAGSLGINLVGANRVIVFDASWNPCHDTQAVCRVYRYGQKKPCYVYRLVMDNCLEKKIYERQVNKQGMADRVVDECNPEARLSIREVTSLCWNDGRDPEVLDFKESLDSFDDGVMKTVLSKHNAALTKKPFEHESLLVDRKDQKLSKYEKKIARQGYEKEKQASLKPTYIYNSQGIAIGTHYKTARPENTLSNNTYMPGRPVQNDFNIQSQTPVQRMIPVEAWQRRGMQAQTFVLPKDVVIPTSSKSNYIPLKKGQRVTIVKSDKAILMQLENGKIVAIKRTEKNNGTDKGTGLSAIDNITDLTNTCSEQQTSIDGTGYQVDLTASPYNMISSTSMENRNTTTSTISGNSTEKSFGLKGINVRSTNRGTGIYLNESDVNTETNDSAYSSNLSNSTMPIEIEDDNDEKLGRQSMSTYYNNNNNNNQNQQSLPMNTASYDTLRSPQTFASNNSTFTSPFGMSNQSMYPPQQYSINTNHTAVSNNTYGNESNANAYQMDSSRSTDVNSQRTKLAYKPNLISRSVRPTQNTQPSINKQLPTRNYPQYNSNVNSYYPSWNNSTGNMKPVHGSLDFLEKTTRSINATNSDFKQSLNDITRVTDASLYPDTNNKHSVQNYNQQQRTDTDNSKSGFSDYNRTTTNMNYSNESNIKGSSESAFHKPLNQDYSSGYDYSQYSNKRGISSPYIQPYAGLPHNYTNPGYYPSSQPSTSFGTDARSNNGMYSSEPYGSSIQPNSSFVSPQNYQLPYTGSNETQTINNYMNHPPIYPYTNNYNQPHSSGW